MRSSTAKDSIADAYLRILQSGKDDLSVTDIIRESGVSRQTFYYHFRGRDDLLEYVVERLLKEINSKCVPENTPKENISIVMNSLYDRIDLLRTIDNGPNKEKHRQLFTKMIERIMRDRILSTPKLANRLSVSELDLLVTMHAYSVVGLYAEALDSGKSFDPDAATEMLYNIFSGKIPIFL